MPNTAECTIDGCMAFGDERLVVVCHQHASTLRLPEGEKRAWDQCEITTCKKFGDLRRVIFCPWHEDKQSLTKEAKMRAKLEPQEPTKSRWEWLDTLVVVCVAFAVAWILGDQCDRIDDLEQRVSHIEQRE